MTSTAKKVGHPCLENDRQAVMSQNVTKRHFRSFRNRQYQAKYLNLLVRPAGFEPATYGFVVRRSIRAELRARHKFSNLESVNRPYVTDCQSIIDHRNAETRYQKYIHSHRTGLR